MTGPTRTTASIVDTEGFVWIGGNGGTDGLVLKFTRDGKFVKQFGKKGVKADSNATDHFFQVAKIFVDEKTNELYVADGYGNKRVVVMDTETGTFKRYWGAYGNKPDDKDLGRYNPTAPLAQQFRNPVHCADLSADGFVYVCDRVNDRMQVFTKEGKFVKEAAVPEGLARRRVGVGRRLLEGSAAEVHLSCRTAATRRSGSSIAQSLQEVLQLRRGRPLPGPVLLDAQHRDRLEGQPLHDGNLPGPSRAEVRLQGHRHGAAQGHGRRLADVDQPTERFRH